MTAAASARAGTATIFVNGQKVAEGRIERTQPMIFSADETADVGVDDATPVTEDYKEGDNAVHRQDPQGADRRRGGWRRSGGDDRRLNRQNSEDAK